MAARSTAAYWRGPSQSIGGIASGYAALEQGKYDDASRSFAKVLDPKKTPKFFLHWYWRMNAQLGLSNVWLASGNLRKARLEADRFLSPPCRLPSPTCTRWRGTWRHESRWRRRTGRVRRRRSRRGSRFCSAFEIPTTAWRVHATRSDLYRQAKNETAAEADRARAEAIILALANSFAPDDPLRHAFLAAAPVRRIRVSSGNAGGEGAGLGRPERRPPTWRPARRPPGRRTTSSPSSNRILTPISSCDGGRWSYRRPMAQSRKTFGSRRNGTRRPRRARSPARPRVRPAPRRPRATAATHGRPSRARRVRARRPRHVASGAGGLPRRRPARCRAGGLSRDESRPARRPADRNRRKKRRSVPCIRNFPRGSRPHAVFGERSPLSPPPPRCSRLPRHAPPSCRSRPAARRSTTIPPTRSIRARTLASPTSPAARSRPARSRSRGRRSSRRSPAARSRSSFARSRTAPG